MFIACKLLMTANKTQQQSRACIHYKHISFYLQVNIKYVVNENRLISHGTFWSLPCLPSWECEHSVSNPVFFVCFVFLSPFLHFPPFSVLSLIPALFFQLFASKLLTPVPIYREIFLCELIHSKSSYLLYEEFATERRFLFVSQLLTWKAKNM